MVRPPFILGWGCTTAKSILVWYGLPLSSGGPTKAKSILGGTTSPLSHFPSFLLSSLGLERSVPNSTDTTHEEGKAHIDPENFRSSLLFLSGYPLSEPIFLKMLHGTLPSLGPRPWLAQPYWPVLWRAYGIAMACDQWPAQRRSEKQRRKSRPKIATAPDTSVKDKAQRSPPYATEERWQERIRHRREGVQHVKKTKPYRNMAAERSADPDAARDAPRTPDSSNREVSKREWEKSVQRWRSDLQRWAKPVSSSPVSSS